jgi:hypothetical protein
MGVFAFWLNRRFVFTGPGKANQPR